MPLLPGAQLGPYLIESAIGAGGMGEVWKARDTRLDRIVAIKTIHGTFSERFEREARAISALNHPHICSLFDVGEHEGAGYLVLEYVEGAPLKGPQPLDRALKYASQICDALDAAHRNGIVHRDLKPDNILLTKAGVKLLDFGLAKLAAPTGAGSAETASGVRREAEIAATKALTGAHMILGTPQYMAPEQIEGRDADARTDLFAFGCVLYELLTGQKAFDGKTASSTMAAILATEPRPLRELQPVTPPALERIVKRCLAKDPDDRWQTARDLRAELDWIVDGGAAWSEAAANARPAANSLPWKIAAGALAIVSLVTLWAPWRTPDVSGRSYSFEIYPPEREGFFGAPMLSPDGQRVAIIVRGADGKSSVMVRRLDSLTGRKLPDTEGINLSSPTWSPDGRSLAFMAGGKVKKIDLDGGPSQTLCEGSGAPFVAWSRDGRLLFSDANVLKRVSASGGVPVQATRLDASRQETSHEKPQFLPDGRHFLFFAKSTQAENNAMFAGAVDSDQRTLVLSTQYNAIYARDSAGSGYLLHERRGALMAQSFDASTLQLKGDAFPVVEQIGFMGATTLAISVSETGGLAYSSVLSGPIANRQFVWIDRTGKQLGNVGPPASYFEFSLSPDDKRLAASRIDGANADIWVVDLLHDRGASRFTFTPRPDRSPLWSPDGSRISFSSGGALYEKPAGGGVERMISAAPGSLLDWSRDGRFLLYQDKDDLWILTDGKPAPLLKTEFRERLGQFAPDGNYVAYASDESKRNDVYVQSFPGSSGKWMISPAGGSQPRWRRDGKELFFVALDGRMMSVPVKTDSGFEPGAATALFEMPEFQQGLFAGAFAYAVSGDGQRFLILRSAEPANLRPVTVMTNWLAGVKK